MKNKKGFTLIEMVVSFSIIMVVIIYFIKAITVSIQKENELLSYQDFNIFKSMVLKDIYAEDSFNPVIEKSEDNDKIRINSKLYKLPNNWKYDTTDDKSIEEAYFYEIKFTNGDLKESIKVFHVK